MALLISCETAGNQSVDQIEGLNVSEQNPSAGSYQHCRRLCELQQRPGVADCQDGEIAKQLADALSAPLIRHDYPLCLIDVTLPVGHRNLFGVPGCCDLPDPQDGLVPEFHDPLAQDFNALSSVAFGKDVQHGSMHGSQEPVDQTWSPQQQAFLIQSIYQSYRQRLESQLSALIDNDSPVLHLSVRTFPGKRNGEPYRTDVGLLYDTKRALESALCYDWVYECYEETINLKLRRNYPRRGSAESITKAMRRLFGELQYLGVEVWLNQSWAGRDSVRRQEALAALGTSLQAVWQAYYSV
ncbi:N-formylglutamate amidohydrolase [Stieleria bergensis]|uniref:N-formylglutamate amidohydrolase n=1 Tax=Stieleria bergensis TaxID=2528025 RepID=A0A517SXL0_9BACT|nr:N-formylglutamate amidohydrolase [Planctomycetes bacterium SV_7m_r]